MAKNPIKHVTQMNTLNGAIRDRGLGQRQFNMVSRALADPRRYAMLVAIASSDGPCACSTLTDTQDVSAATISHHLKELEGAGLIVIVREGKFARLVFQRALFETYIKQLAALRPHKTDDDRGLVSIR